MLLSMRRLHLANCLQPSLALVEHRINPPLISGADSSVSTAFPLDRWKGPRWGPFLFRGEVLRQHLDLGRQDALVEQQAFEFLDELIALGDLLPLMFQV